MQRLNLLTAETVTSCVSSGADDARTQKRPDKNMDALHVRDLASISDQKRLEIHAKSGVSGTA